jgi:hypothetical protein
MTTHLSRKPAETKTSRRFWMMALTFFATATLSREAQAAMYFTNASASGITATGVTSLNTDIESTSNVVYSGTFDFGTTTSYGTTIYATPTANNIPKLFVGTFSSDPITGLTCGTVYHYRINVAAAGTDVDHTFTTSACQSVPTLSEWGMIILGLMFIGSMFLVSRRGQIGTPA